MAIFNSHVKFTSGLFIILYQHYPPHVLECQESDQETFLDAQVRPDKEDGTNPILDGTKGTLVGGFKPSEKC